MPQQCLNAYTLFGYIVINKKASYR